MLASAPSKASTIATPALPDGTAGFSLGRGRGVPPPASAGFPVAAAPGSHPQLREAEGPASSSAAYSPSSSGSLLDATAGFEPLQSAHSAPAGAKGPYSSSTWQTDSGVVLPPPGLPQRSASQQVYDRHTVPSQLNGTDMGGSVGSPPPVSKGSIEHRQAIPGQLPVSSMLPLVQHMRSSTDLGVSALAPRPHESVSMSPPASRNSSFDVRQTQGVHSPGPNDVRRHSMHVGPSDNPNLLLSPIRSSLSQLHMGVMNGSIVLPGAAMSSGFDPNSQQGSPCPPPFDSMHASTSIAPLSSRGFDAHLQQQAVNGMMLPPVATGHYDGQAAASMGGLMPGLGGMPLSLQTVLPQQQQLQGVFNHPVPPYDSFAGAPSQATSGGTFSPPLRRVTSTAQLFDERMAAIAQEAAAAASFFSGGSNGLAKSSNSFGSLVLEHQHSTAAAQHAQHVAAAAAAAASQQHMAQLEANSFMGQADSGQGMSAGQQLAANQAGLARQRSDITQQIAVLQQQQQQQQQQHNTALAAAVSQQMAAAQQAQQAQHQMVGGTAAPSLFDGGHVLSHAQTAHRSASQHLAMAQHQYDAATRALSPPPISQQQLQQQASFEMPSIGSTLPGGGSQYEVSSRASSMSSLHAASQQYENNAHAVAAQQQQYAQQQQQQQQQQLQQQQQQQAQAQAQAQQAQALHQQQMAFEVRPPLFESQQHAAAAVNAAIVAQAQQQALQKQVQAAQQQQQAAVAAHQVAASQVAAHMQAAAAADAALVAPSAFDGQQQQQGLGFDGPQQVLGFDARGGLQGMYGGQSLPPPPPSGGTGFDRGGTTALGAQALARQGSGLGQGPSLSSQGSGLGQTMGLASQGSGFESMNGTFDSVYTARQRAIKFGVPPIVKSAEPADFVPTAQYEKLKRDNTRLAAEVERLEKEVLRQKSLRETERMEFSEAKERLKHSWAADRDDFARVKEALKKKNADHHVQNGRLSQALKESEAISRSLRELCVRATIPLPPELEGAVEALDAKLDPRFDLGTRSSDALSQQQDANTIRRTSTDLPQGLETSAATSEGLLTGTPASGEQIPVEKSFAVAVPAVVVDSMGVSGSAALAVPIRVSLLLQPNGDSHATAAAAASTVPAEMLAVESANTEHASAGGEIEIISDQPVDSAAAAAAAAATAAAALGQLAAALTTQFQEQAEAAGLISPPPESTSFATDGDDIAGSGTGFGTPRSQGEGFVSGPVDMVAAAAKALACLSSLVHGPRVLSAPIAMPDALEASDVGHVIGSGASPTRSTSPEKGYGVLSQN